MISDLTWAWPGPPKTIMPGIHDRECSPVRAEYFLEFPIFTRGNCEEESNVFTIVLSEAALVLNFKRQICG